MSDFYQAVYKLVKQIPPGKVATYGQVAALLGKPRAAQLIGWALKVCPNDVPWQRVLNREGRISIENLNTSKDEQAERLRNEAVCVNFREGNFWVDLNQYLWNPE